MPITEFICPDGQTIACSKCLSPNGCRMKNRCATLPYLEAVADDRKFKRVTPSMSGNGPRLIYLKAITDYAVDPEKGAWALMGVHVHDKLSFYKYTKNVIAEEEMTDEKTKGIPDVLEADEDKPGYYILTDYKTYGSYKLRLVLGLVSKTVPMLDEEGEPVLYKTSSKKYGYKKGDPRKKTEWVVDPSKIKNWKEELQINRYRIFFEEMGFPISRMRIQAIPRDGNTKNARLNGIERLIYMIDIARIDDDRVLAYYDKLAGEVDQAFKNGTIRKCEDWECWGGRRCDGFCEVREACDRMEKGEKIYES